MCANEFGTNNTAEKRDYWTPQLPDKFKGPKKFKASRITPREALAFSVIALPGQFSAISNVLEEARTRLGEHWSENVKTIIDFGSGAGAGIWFVAHCVSLVYYKLIFLSRSSLTIFRKKAELASDQVEPVSDVGYFLLVQWCSHHYTTGWPSFWGASGLEHHPALFVS